MAKPLTVTSPQFRIQLVRKIRNLAPSCTLEFVADVNPGIGFRLKDSRGRYRSNLVRFPRYRAHLLDAGNLTSAVRTAGVPPAGLPKEFNRF